MRCIGVVIAALLVSGLANAEQWEITADVANVRLGPATDATIIAKAYKGDVVEEVYEASKWRKIRKANGAEGWIHKSLMTRAGSSNRPAAEEYDDFGMSDETVLSWLVVLLAIYFFPTGVALCRGHHNQGPILILNLFLGWTLLGWVVSLAMAVAPVKREPRLREGLHHDG